METFLVSIIPGSALCALEGKNPDIGEKSILALLNVVDKEFKLPDRNISTEPMFAVEHVYVIKGIFEFENV